MPVLRAIGASFLCACAIADPGVACSDESTAQSIAAGIDLKGTLAVVTGGDSGLGYSTAEALAKQGAAVVIAGHSADKSASAATNISTKWGVNAQGLSLDLANFSSVRNFVAELHSRYGEPNLRILINDAGITTPGKKKTT
jgi:NAD(P)-dependent dehydrogenase (short-subunit alcohol dehydrogenase family)